VLVALTLLAAACSSAPPVGAVGATLPAMDGTITLDKVISPAPVVAGSIGAPYGHKLVATVLTVHAPSSSSAKFAGIYSASKLVDSKKLSHRGRSAAKYTVADCASYPPFTSVAAGQSATGCVVFVLSYSATPVELKISGKAEASWTIAPTAVQPGTGGAALGTVPATVPTTVPTTSPGAEAIGATSTTVAGATPPGGAGTTTTVAGGTTTTAVPGAQARTGGGTTTTAPGGAETTTTKAIAVSARHGRHPGATKASKIVRVAPRGGAVGTRVTISGKRLNDASEVTFNGVPATITHTAPNKVVVVVPSGATQGYIEVTTPSGTVTSPREFLVL
jgi:hypothetical protein